jgi:hypothetical protein
MNKRARFERRAAPSPSFNRGWRLGVSIGAAVLIVAVAALILVIAGEVWNEY